MKNKLIALVLTPLAVSVAFATQAQAAVTLYDQDGTTFSADGHFNAFYTSTNDKETNEKQGRVRMGFLPNWIGFNVSQKHGDLTLGGRSSLWVTINDGSNSVTDTAIDVRQFYGTVDSDAGQILFGKDFGLYARSNIFNDELLLGTGLPMTSGAGVTFGNISTGYPYAVPKAQITYRSPDLSGLKIAAGILDPQSGESANANTTDSVRLEAEAVYSGSFDNVNYSAWLGAASGSDDASGVDATGLAYGARATIADLQLTVSGFDQTGIDAALADRVLGAETDSDGYLVQGSYTMGKNRLVLSHGETTVDGSGTTELNAIALFHSVTDNFKLIAEYDIKSSSSQADTNQLALGAALSW